MALELKPGITLYFCRHGETEANVEKRFQGDHTNTPLTAKGREQALAVAGTVRREMPHPASYACVSSPLVRACLTMEIIREALGLAPKGYTTDTRIEEIDLGSWDGLTDAQARALDPAAFDARMANKGAIRVPGGGENYADVSLRATSWVYDLGADTFAVSHGAFTRILRGLFLGLSWEQMSALDEPQGVVFRVRGSTVERLEKSP
jgi:probable phosphoglycerate mutase